MNSCFALTGVRQHCVSTVLVMLMSRNDFHVVSALQFIVFDLYTIFFWLIKSFVNPTLAALIICSPLQLFSLSFMYFWAVGLSDPIRCVLKHGTGHAVLNV